MGGWEVGKLQPAGFTVRLALFYGAVFLLLGAYVPYFPVWLNGRGLSASQIGIVLAAPALVRIFFTPAMGFLADRIGDRRKVLKALGWGALLFCALLALAHGFAPILLLATVFALFWTTVMPLTETLAMTGVREAGHDYGRMRLWGSLTFVVASTGGGVALQAFGPEAALAMMGLGASAIALATFLLPPPTGRGVLKAAAAIPRVRLRDALRLTHAPLFLLFLASAGIAQATHAVYYAFGTLHWASLGISGGVIGLLWTVGVVAEIVLFAFSGRIVAAVGTVPLIVIAAGAAVLRWAITALDPPLWLLFPVQTLHALTFGAAHLGAIHFIGRAVPHEYAATAQGLYASVTAGIMMGLATMAAGPLYRALGAHAYLAMAGLGCVAVAGAWVLMRRWQGEPLIAIGGD